MAQILLRWEGQEKTMIGIQEIIGLFACLGPIFGIVAYLIWASHRPRCPHCGYAVSAEKGVCSHCGETVDPGELDDSPNRTEARSEPEGHAASPEIAERERQPKPKARKRPRRQHLKHGR